MMDFIAQLTSLGERQREVELQARDMIVSLLQKQGVSYQVQDFSSRIPKYGKAELVADGVSLPMLPNCFVGGDIEGKDHLISSLLSAAIVEPNINFNPHCDVIAKSDHYFAPAVAIQKSDVQTILDAKDVRGYVEVEPVDMTLSNILVGNTTDPKTIMFCHYDSLGPGAVDNASGTAVLLDLILTYPETLDTILYVIAGNEEISYDQPTYWGRGYRAFEEMYHDVLEHAEQIFVVDCVGNAPTTIEQNIDIVNLGFPIVNLEKWKQHIFMFYGSMEELMTVYHSDADTVEKVQEEYLQECVSIIRKRLG